MIQEEITHLGALNLCRNRLMKFQLCLNEEGREAESKTVQIAIDKLEKKINELVIQALRDWGKSADQFINECENMSAEIEVYTKDIQKNIGSAEKIISALGVVKQLADKIDDFI